jgi:transcription initiation factor TFIIB
LHTIYPVYGLNEFKDQKITKKLIIQHFGEPDEIVSHFKYSVEMKYKLGLRFYYLQSEAEKSDNPFIITIGFRSPFQGTTEEGIVLNKSNMDQVFKIMGKENWLTTDDDIYWWVEHSGMSFYIKKAKDIDPSNFNEIEEIKKKIVRITVPVKYIEEDALRNEDGVEIKSVEDFCLAGGLHSIIHDEERAEDICGKCGLVMSERMISMAHSGTRSFSSEERNKRDHHGSPINALIPDIQMATMIDKRGPMSESLRKAVKWDSRYTWKQRNMIQATSEIKRIGELLNLPQRAKISAIKLYRRAFQLGLLKGRSIKAMVSASLYYACGSGKVPRTLGEIVKVSDSNFHDVTKSYQVMIKELHLSSPTIDPGLLVSKFIPELHLTYQVEVLALKILEKYEKVYSLSGKDPKGLVAGALYIAAIREKIKISQTKISKAIGITEVTLRNRLREMQRFMK